MKKDIVSKLVFANVLTLSFFVSGMFCMQKKHEATIQCMAERTEKIEQQYKDTILSLKEDKFELKLDIVSLQTKNTDLTLQLEDSKDKVKELTRTLNTSYIPEYNYTYSEVLLLAKCVQAEAGVKNYEAQKMVTKVILNRLEDGSFPSTIKEVIYQKRGKIPQFSVAYDGAIERQDLKPETLNNVLHVLMFGYDMPDNVLFFYASYVEENWVNKLRVYKSVQGTTFCYDD